MCWLWRNNTWILWKPKTSDISTIPKSTWIHVLLCFVCQTLFWVYLSLLLFIGGFPKLIYKIAPFSEIWKKSPPIIFYREFPFKGALFSQKSCVRNVILNWYLLCTLFRLKRVPLKGNSLYKIMGGDFFSNFWKGGDFENKFWKPCFRL